MIRISHNTAETEEKEAVDIGQHLFGPYKVIRSVSVIVMQDTGDLATGLHGYFTLDLGNLPHGAKYFALDNLFIRSSFPNTTSIPFGVSSLSFATAR